MGGLSAQQSQKWSFYLISKNQIVILMLVMTLMGRMKTVPRMKVLRRGCFSEKCDKCSHSTIDRTVYSSAAQTLSQYTWRKTFRKGTPCDRPGPLTFVWSVLFLWSCDPKQLAAEGPGIPGMP